MRDGRGLVFNIQRFSVSDGPGIRTTVFMKGCNLRCQWCHNPEAVRPVAEVQYFAERCASCGDCVPACPHGAHSLDGLGQHQFDRTRCDGCGLCAEACTNEAMMLAGRLMTIEQVVDEVVKDEDYYQTSGGGLTVSGGEPVLQRRFVAQLFEQTKGLQIHNALDTAALCSWSAFSALLPWVDLVLLDLKLMDERRHLEFTGAYNQQILRNARQLAGEDVDLIVRIPVVRGVNDTIDNMTRTADFLRPFPRLLRVDLLPYHALGAGKQASLGHALPGPIFTAPSMEHLDQLAAVFTRAGIAVAIA
jgi:pyruvate formate lyase activating enzyme